MANLLTISCVLICSFAPTCDAIVAKRPHPMADSYPVADKTSETFASAPTAVRRHSTGSRKRSVRAGSGRVEKMVREIDEEIKARRSGNTSAMKNRKGSLNFFNTESEMSANQTGPGWNWQPVNPYGYWAYGSGSPCYINGGCTPPSGGVYSWNSAMRELTEPKGDADFASTRNLKKESAKPEDSEGEAPAQIFIDDYWRLRIPCNVKCASDSDMDEGTLPCNDMTYETMGFNKKGKAYSSKVKYEGFFIRQFHHRRSFAAFDSSIDIELARGSCGSGSRQTNYDYYKTGELCMDDNILLRQDKCAWGYARFEHARFHGGMSSKGPASHTCPIAGAPDTDEESNQNMEMNY